MIAAARGLVALGLALVACTPMAPPAAEPEVSAGNWLLPGTDWRLVELDGAPFAAALTATLTSDGRVVGQGPCNAFSAPYQGRWPDLTFEPAAVMRMACPELDLETAALETLGRVTRGALGPDGLTLSAPDGGFLRLERVS